MNKEGFSRRGFLGLTTGLVASKVVPLGGGGAVVDAVPRPVVTTKIAETSFIADGCITFTGALPETGVAGQVVFLTADDKLYHWCDWVRRWIAVEAGDDELMAENGTSRA